MKVAGLIPAKGTSARVPNKNLQEILGVPLFLWAANNLSRVLDRRDIYIDTDSEEIEARAKALGFGTLRRPAELATNATDGNELMRWEASQVEADIYVQHLPPMVFLSEKTLRDAIARVSADVESAFGVRREAFYLWTEDGPSYDLAQIPNSFTLPELVMEGMGLYVTRAEALRRAGTRVTERYAMIELDRFEGIDIDLPEDLAFARAVAQGLEPSSEYRRGIDELFVRDDIKLLILDVDGVMTDGGMIYADTDLELKRFNTRDGVGIKRALEAGAEVGFLSAGSNEPLVRRRAQVLGVERVYAGNEPKLRVAERWAQEMGVELSEVAFIGDDLPDLELGERVGCFACPSDAAAPVRGRAHVRLAKRGGEGCVREFVDRFLRAP